MRQTRTFLVPAISGRIARRALPALCTLLAAAMLSWPRPGLAAGAATGATAASSPGMRAAGPSSLLGWQWLDGNGRRVFSDRPPPADIPPHRILRRPGAEESWPAAGTAAGAAPASGRGATDAIPTPTPEASARQRAASAARPAQLSASQQAEEERIARQRADNCQRARSALATLDAGVRLVRTNEKGEREILDDAAREAERRHLQQIVASDCAPR